MTTQILSIIAVAGAWIAGLGSVFTVMAFCFGILRPGLLRAGFIYLLITDLGVIAMLAALLGILESSVLWWFSAVGLVALIGFTVAAFLIVRGAGRGAPASANVLETTRRRIEF